MYQSWNLMQRKIDWKFWWIISLSIETTTLFMHLSFSYVNCLILSMSLVKFISWIFSSMVNLLHMVSIIYVVMDWAHEITMYDFHNSTDTLKFWTEKQAINMFFVFHPILMKLSEVIVPNVYYNFTKFHQNWMKNK